jgi:hypothetical protein
MKKQLELFNLFFLTEKVVRRVNLLAVRLVVVAAPAYLFGQIVDVTINQAHPNSATGCLSDLERWFELTISINIFCQHYN